MHMHVSSISSSPASLRRLLFLCLYLLVATAIHSFPIFPSSKKLLSPSVSSICSQYDFRQRGLLPQILCTRYRIHHDSSRNVQKLSSLPSSAADDGIDDQVAKARKLIEQAKAKVAAAEAEKDAAATTTVRSVNNNNNTNTKEEEILKRKESVIKTHNEETGLITTDGELMAALSETEDWKARSFGEIFADDTDDLIEDGLASRDVAASIFNLRMHLNDADYRRVFDKRNRFIGEDN